MTTCSFIKTVSKCDSQLKVMIEKKNLSGAERFSVTQDQFCVFKAGTLSELVFVNSEFKSHYFCKLC